MQNPLFTFTTFLYTICISLVQCTVTYKGAYLRVNISMLLSELLVELEYNPVFNFPYIRDRPARFDRSESGPATGLALWRSSTAVPFLKVFLFKFEFFIGILNCLIPTSL
jgi:hypothetical protein